MTLSAATTKQATVAALFVETNGVYYGLPNVDPWDESRDARLYAGPWPVVAHPPCNKWSTLAYINAKLIPGYRVGDDGGCFEAALAAVRAYGGVLEHPATSLAWKRYGLPRPVGRGWTRSLLDEGWVCSVSQAAYGHRAGKKTFLYYMGASPPVELDWSRPAVTARVSAFRHFAKGQYEPCEAIRVRPAEASRTPTAFRDVLIDIAKQAAPKGEALQSTQETEQSEA